MKLKNELDTIKEKIKEIGIEKIKQYSKELYESKQYKNFDTKLAFDILHATKDDNNYINYLYNQYNCNDNHIETLLIKALKELKII